MQRITNDIFMNACRSFLVLFFSCLLVAVGFADKKIQPKTIEANARAGKKVSLTFLLPEKIDRDAFIKSNRLMAGMWMKRTIFDKKVRIKENDTHWIGDVHYPTYNYHGARLYMVGGIKIRKTPAIQALPAKEKEALLKILRTRGDLILKETGKVKEYDVVAFHDGVEKVFSVFTLNNQWMFKDFGKAIVVTVEMDQFGGVRIGGQPIPLEEIANKVNSRFPTKVVIRASKSVPQEKVQELVKTMARLNIPELKVESDSD
ncbi:MAG: hypothetical protein CMI31_07010 [Opitutae bacterium]|nr:hypothetical protein [Opitutae bacterium]